MDPRNLMAAKARLIHSQSGESARPHGSSTPGLLIVSPGVDADLAELAGSLCSAPVAHAPLTAGAIRRAIDPDRRTALLLLHPEATPARVTLEILAALEESRIPVGVVYAFDPADAARTLRRALGAPLLPAAGTFAFISGTYDVPGAHRAFSDPYDVLVLSGHANALDASLGPDLVLCAREGHVAPPDAPNVFPCFNDGVCLRQRPNGAARELIGIPRVHAHVLVLSGCNVLPLGRTWSRIEAGLAYQAASGDCAAVIASSATSVGSLELDLLCVALLAEGLPFGEVVAEINRVRRDELQHCTGLPPGVGPFVLLGNPAARLEGFALRDAAAEVRDGVLRIDRRGGEGLLRASVPASAAGNHLIVARGAEDDAWCRGILHARGGESPLYVWTGASSAPLEVELRAHDAAEPTRRAFAEFWSELHFWMLFLDAYREASRADGTHVDALERLTAELPGFSRLLASALLTTRSAPGVLVSESPAAYHAVLREEIALWSEALLQAVVTVVGSIGRVHSYGNTPHYGLSDRTVRGLTCSCGESELSGQEYVSVDGRMTRVELQCGICGAVDDEDGRHRLRVVRHPSFVTTGEILSSDCAFEAGDVALQGSAVAMLDTWRSGRRVVGEPHRAWLAPGSAASFRLDVAIPSDLVPGVYALTIVGVVNGALSLSRRMIRIAGTGKEGSTWRT